MKNSNFDWFTVQENGHLLKLHPISGEDIFIARSNIDPICEATNTALLFSGWLVSGQVQLFLVKLAKFLQVPTCKNCFFLSDA